MTADATPLPPPATPPRTALITGVAGYLGTTLCHHLLAEGWALAGLDSPAGNAAQVLPLGVPVVRGDVRDPEAVAEAIGRLGKAPEVVFHLAALIQVGESMRQPERYHAVNAGGTAQVVESALLAGVEAVVLASSAAVLATAEGGADRMDETWPLGPASPYGASKVAAEQTLAAACDTGRMAGTALRIFNLCGAAHGCAERHLHETHLIPLAIAAAMGTGPALQIHGDDFATADGTPLRDYVHIEDVVAALVAAAQRAVQRQRSGVGGFEVYHVGSGVGRSVYDVLAAVERVLGRPVPRQVGPRRAGDCAALVADPTLLRRQLGVAPASDLDRMVADAAHALGVAPAG